MKIYCLGAAHLDVKAFPLVKPSCGESIPVFTTTCHGGVVRNIAENLATLGAEPLLFSMIGNDAEGVRLMADLSKIGIDVTDVIISNEHPTAKYYAILDLKGELFVATADMGIYEQISPTQALSKTSQRHNIVDWVIDANLPEETIAAVAENASSKQRLWGVAVSAAKAPRLKHALPNWHGLFLNRNELIALTAQKDLHQGMHFLLENEVKHVVVTAGAEGVFYTKDESVHFQACPPVDIIEVTGAGDAFSASVIYALVQGEDIDDAIQYGFSSAKKVLSSSNSALKESTP